LFGGLAAHSILPLEWLASSAPGLVLGLAGHAVGWPFPRGGARRLSEALASYLGSLGGEIHTGFRVESLDEISEARPVLLDVTPRQLLRLAKGRLSEGYRRCLARYRYGPGVFKMDWALDAPIPWAAAECARSGTVHLGGTLEEICESERAPWEGHVAERPFVLVSQPTLFDPSRAPRGKHVAWAYCHVPHGWAENLTDRIESQIDRFAPGFRDRVLARRESAPAALAVANDNLVGGDIGGGAATIDQLFTRPNRHLYRTSIDGVYLCSASTPPGGGVHGMCGYHAARIALDDLRGTSFAPQNS
jgi:phytoene dehydrogenase-like protein